MIQPNDFRAIEIFFCPCSWYVVETGLQNIKSSFGNNVGKTMTVDGSCFWNLFSWLEWAWDTTTLHGNKNWGGPWHPKKSERIENFRVRHFCEIRTLWTTFISLYDNWTPAEPSSTNVKLERPTECRMGLHTEQIWVSEHNFFTLPYYSFCVITLYTFFCPINRLFIVPANWTKILLYIFLFPDHSFSLSVEVIILYLPLSFNYSYEAPRLYRTAIWGKCIIWNWQTNYKHDGRALATQLQ